MTKEKKACAVGLWRQYTETISLKSAQQTLHYDASRGDEPGGAVKCNMCFLKSEIVLEDWGCMPGINLLMGGRRKGEEK